MFVIFVLSQFHHFSGVDGLAPAEDQVDESKHWKSEGGFSHFLPRFLRWICVGFFCLIFSRFQLELDKNKNLQFHISDLGAAKYQSTVSYQE